jgi:hypothetical protein
VRLLLPDRQRAGQLAQRQAALRRAHGEEVAPAGRVRRGRSAEQVGVHRQPRLAAAQRAQRERRLVLRLQRVHLAAARAGAGRAPRL